MAMKSILKLLGNAGLSKKGSNQIQGMKPKD